MSAVSALSVVPLTLATVRVDVTGVDIEAVVEAAADDRVAVMPGASVDRSAILAQVDRARAENLPLTVVVLPQALNPSDAELVANDVLRQLRGTVLVLSADGYAAVSDSVGESRMQTASDAIGELAAAGAGKVAMVTVFVGVLTEGGFPWSLLLAAGGVVLVAVVGVLFWSGRSRSSPNG